jgi:hypothetical protein
MSLTLDGTASARIAAAVRGVAWLVQLDFTTGTIYYTTAPQSFVISSQTYIGLGNLADVSPVGESENTGADQVVLGFSLVNTALLAATIGNVDTYRGRAVRLYLQLFDEAFQPAGAPVLRWSGTMQPVKVSRTPSDPAGGASVGRLELPCTRAGMARARNAQGLRLSHAQQLQRYPGDVGLEYVQTLIEQPSLWLSKRFQAQR